MIAPGWRAALREALTDDGDRALVEVIRQLDLPEDDPPDNLALPAARHGERWRERQRAAGMRPR